MIHVTKESDYRQVIKDCINEKLKSDYFILFVLRECFKMNFYPLELISILFNMFYQPFDFNFQCNHISFFTNTFHLVCEKKVQSRMEKETHVDVSNMKKFFMNDDVVITLTKQNKLVFLSKSNDLIIMNDIKTFITSQTMKQGLIYMLSNCGIVTEFNFLRTEYKAIASDAKLFGRSHKFGIYVKNNNDAFSIEFPSYVHKFLIKNVLSISVGGRYAMVVTHTFDLYGYGYISKILGLDNDILYDITKVPIPDKIISVKCHFGYGIALTYNHDIYAWGKFEYNTNISAVPTKLNIKNVISIFCGKLDMVLISTKQIYIDESIENSVTNNET